MRIPSGVTDQYIYFVAVDATDFTTRETGLSSWTVYRSRNGGAAAQWTTPTINETDNTNMPGVYELLVDEDTTLDAGDQSQEMAIHITHAGMAPVTRTIEIYRPSVTAGETIGVSSGAVDTVDALGTQAKADVNAEVVDALATDTYAEPTGVPAATATLAAKIGAIHMKLRNKVTITSSKETVFDDSDNAEYEHDLSDDSTTFTRSEANAV